MFATSRIVLTAFLLATPLAIAQATPPGTDHDGGPAPASGRTITGTATPASPGFGMAQTGPSEDQIAAEEEDNDADDSGVMTGPGRMGCGAGMMGHGMGGGGMGGMGGTAPPMMLMMRGMMQAMQGMMMMMEHQPSGPMASGMMPGRFVEDHLSSLKNRLGITAAQEPQWNAFADAIRARVAATQKMRGEMMQQAAPADWPDRLTQQERRLSARLDALKATEGPTKALWDALSDEQHREAENMMPTMGMGMPMR